MRTVRNTIIISMILLNTIAGAGWAGELGDMVACCDVDRQHAERFAGALDGKCAIYGDYRKVIERDDVDAVTIGTPDHWHVKIAVEAMEAGLDVYCEKPVSLTIDEGKLICKVVKETGRVLQVGSDQRSDRRILRGIALARSGRLGKALTARVGLPRYLTGGPFPATEAPAHLDWDRWLGQAPAVPYCPQRCHGLFRMWLEYSGGSLTDWGAHHVDVAMLGLRQENTGPVEIEGQGLLPDVPNGYNIAVDYTCTLRFEDGSTMIVSDDRDRGVLFEGEDGRFFINRNRLTGLPLEIGQLNNLKTMDLSNNQIRMLPPSIGNLSAMRSLNLSRNNLESLPPEIGQMHNLRGLNINFNSLTELPPEIGKLVKLEKLFAGKNRLMDLPDQIIALSPYVFFNDNKVSF